VQSLAHWSDQGGHVWLRKLIRVDPATSVPYLALLNLLVYSPCFLLGMMIAKFDWPPKLGWVLAAVGLAYLLAAIRFPWTNSHAGFGLLYAGIVMASFASHGRLYRILASDFMVWLGERSYSLFLIHFTVFALVNWLTSFVLLKDASYFFVTRAVGLPGAMLAAMVLFWLVERHFARNLATADRFWPPLPDGRESDNS
jgi:peptidoglycan/LPS O-acetylase OafA/YrhL